MVVLLLKEDSMGKRRTYGSGSIRERAGYFEVGVYVNGRQKWERVGKSRKAAELRLLQLREILLEGREDELVGVPFSSLAEKWLSAKEAEVSTSTYEVSENIVNNHLLPHFGKTLCHQLDIEDIEQYRDKKLKGLLEVNGNAWKKPGPETVGKHVATIRAIFTWGMRGRRKLVTYNPADGVKRPVVDREGPQPLTPDQVQKLIDATPEKHKAAMLCLAGLGLRLGEMLGLKISDYDPDARVLTISRTVKGNRGKVELGSRTKTGKSRPLVVDDYLHELIMGQIQKAKALPDPDGLGLLFPNDAGRIMPPNNWRSRVFYKACEKAEIEAHPHQLRHTWASLMFAAGKSPSAIQGWGGWANTRTMLAVYTKMIDEHRQQSASSLEVMGMTPNTDPGETLDETVDETVDVKTEEEVVQQPSAKLDTPRKPGPSLREVGKRRR